MHPTPPPDHCPLCRQLNRCAVAEAAGDGGDVHCWCMDQTFPAAALAQIKSLGEESACLCQACIQRLASLG